MSTSPRTRPGPSPLRRAISFTALPSETSCDGNVDGSGNVWVWKARASTWDVTVCSCIVEDVDDVDDTDSDDSDVINDVRLRGTPVRVNLGGIYHFVTTLTRLAWSDAVVIRRAVAPFVATRRTRPLDLYVPGYFEHPRAMHAYLVDDVLLLPPPPPTPSLDDESVYRVFTAALDTPTHRWNKARYDTHVKAVRAELRRIGVPSANVRSGAVEVRVSARDSVAYSVEPASSCTVL